MTLRGKAAIVGIGEVPTRRTYPGRTTYSLCAEATRLAITDAGLRKEDIDGLVTRGSDISPMDLAEYLGLRLGFCEGVTQHGASGAHSVVVAASAIHARSRRRFARALDARRVGARAVPSPFAHRQQPGRGLADDHAGSWCVGLFTVGHRRSRRVEQPGHHPLHRRRASTSAS